MQLYYYFFFIYYNWPNQNLTSDAPEKPIIEGYNKDDVYKEGDHINITCMVSIMDSGIDQWQIIYSWSRFKNSKILSCTILDIKVYYNKK